MEQIKEMMFLNLIYIVILFFGIGALLTAILNKNSNPEQKRSRWIKYILYLLIVLITAGSIQIGMLIYLAAGLIFTGFIELLWVGCLSRRGVIFGIVSILIYIGIAIGFYRFVISSTSEVLLYIYTIIFTFDGFSQLFGQLFGKRKILPNISPNKTAAGTVGGGITGYITGLLITVHADTFDGFSLILPLLICICAFAGDALASWYKRLCAAKDYSNLIPGHGGILDRYDSFMFTGSVFGLVHLGRIIC
ncbi:phosphatidate cytidylyltransferase [Sphingobacterium spiritivorum]|uniref:phosphatidate cytidylyltransferase n=1 Tax=Sphingobacterium spiritivorum TaxID=258 RepID=UPI003DA5CB43